MFLGKLGWSGVVGLTLVCVACGKSSDGDDDDDTSGGTGGSAAHAAAGKGVAGVAAGHGGTSGTGGDAGAVGGGRGGSGGMSTGGKGGGSGGSSAGKSSAGAGQGGESAGSGGAGRGGAGTGGGDAGAAEGGQSSDTAAIDGAVTTVCAAAETCCTAMGITPMLDMCDSIVHMRDSFEGITRGYITLDRTVLARCKAAYESADDQCNLNAVVAACDGLYVGHQGVGEPCIGGYDCDRATDTMTCLITDNTGDHPVGTCQKVPHAQENGACSSTCRAGEDCSSTTLGMATPEQLALCFEDEGLYCEVLEDDARVCRPTIPIGQPCGAASFDACGSKAQCNTNCEALSDFGEQCGSCFHQYQCIEGKCADPLWADEFDCMGYPPGP